MDIGTFVYIHGILFPLGSLCNQTLTLLPIEYAPIVSMGQPNDVAASLVGSRDDIHTVFDYVARPTSLPIATNLVFYT